MKTLLIDIETFPNVADVWGLWNVNVSLNQLQKPHGLLSFAVKYLHEKRTTAFYGLNEYTSAGLATIAHNYLNDADEVVTWNGDRFDIPMLNSEFVLNKLAPPAPFKSVDLLKVVKKHFRFPSNKLQYVSTALGFDGKVGHSGHQLWTDCLAGKPKAWKVMEKYNKQDVVLLEDLWDELEPWIHNSLNRNLFGGDGCPQCGSAERQKRGFAYTAQGQFQRFQCTDCYTWYKDTTRVAGTKAVK